MDQVFSAIISRQVRLQPVEAIKPAQLNKYPKNNPEMSITDKLVQELKASRPVLRHVQINSLPEACGGHKPPAFVEEDQEMEIGKRPMSVMKELTMKWQLTNKQGEHKSLVAKINNRIQSDSTFEALLKEIRSKGHFSFQHPQLQCYPPHCNDTLEWVIDEIPKVAVAPSLSSSVSLLTLNASIPPPPPPPPMPASVGFCPTPQNKLPIAAMKASVNVPSKNVDNVHSSILNNPIRQILLEQYRLQAELQNSLVIDSNSISKDTDESETIQVLTSPEVSDFLIVSNLQPHGVNGEEPSRSWLDWIWL